jgi:hypothetical protein
LTLALLFGIATLPSMALLGLAKPKEIWVPTLRGWSALAVLTIALAAGVVLGTVRFLSPVQPHHKGILVVEGWLPDYALEEAKRTFESHSYRVLVVTGVPIEQGFYLRDCKDYAQLGAATLRELGMKEDLIAAVSCPEVPKDRTYATARQVRHWLEQQGSHASVDVFTLGVHARRTWLLYRLALEGKHPVGIIAGHDRRYNKRWWTTSSGFRIVTGEMIAFVYAKFLFYPRSSPAP